MAALALTLSCAAPLAQASEDLVRDLRHCSRQLDPELDVGFARIAERCGPLLRTLAASRYAPWLPAGWDEDGNELSAGSLAELATLLEREQLATLQRAPPQVAALHGVLLRLGEPAGARGGLWERFKDWLRSIFQSDEKPHESWLARVLQRIEVGETVWRIVGYAALLIVLGLAALIVVNELRAAGLLARRGAAERRGAEPAGASRRRLTLRDLEHAEPRERPALLLQLIIDALTQVGHLPPAGGLTVRELARSARVDARDGTRLAQLGAAAERARYSATPPDGAELEHSLTGGRELLTTLERRGATSA
jgi:hypothetical protein